MIRTQGEQKIILAHKKNNLKIFLDMDGVITFWVKAAAKALEIDLEDKEIRKEIKQGKRLETFVGGDSKMWPILDKGGEDWWASLEKLPWTEELMELAKKKSTEFCFLTSPSNNPLCAAGKIIWLKNHFGQEFRDFLIGSHKYMCASPNSLLIDDDPKKCKKFEDFGGHAFLWPCPLKLIDEDEKLEDVLTDLKKKITEILN